MLPLGPGERSGRVDPCCRWGLVSFCDDHLYFIIQFQCNNVLGGDGRFFMTECTEIIIRLVVVDIIINNYHHHYHFVVANAHITITIII